MAGEIAVLVESFKARPWPVDHFVPSNLDVVEGLTLSSPAATLFSAVRFPEYLWSVIDRGRLADMTVADLAGNEAASQDVVRRRMRRLRSQVCHE
jgi:hypothetical protein